MAEPSIIHFPARFSPERFTAWRWRVANLGGLVLNYSVAVDTDFAIVNSVHEDLALDSTHVEQELSRADEGFRAVSPTTMEPDEYGYTMHVAKSRRSVPHWAGSVAGIGENPRLEEKLKSLGLDPDLASQAVVMGLMHEVPVHPNQMAGRIDKNNHSIAQPYLLDWVDKGTQRLVQEQK